ncbi:MAG TPA: ABC transporter substrate-binding protein, partial [Alphaproteobacteria bacterium]|nr:ABC transporter substrate-binding protein [Alphaproteobacteria bacterium]
MAESQALTMRGDPELLADFTHFPYANENAPKGGELRLTEVGTFDSVIPWLIKGTVPWQLDWMHDKLMARSWDEPFTLYPLIASAAKLSDDRRTLAFQIDPRAKFQDGHPITAQDVKFSYEFLLKNGRPNTRRIFAAVDDVVVSDAQNISFHFRENSDPEAPMIVAMMTVLPRHYWEPMGARAAQTSLAPPVASGPYKITSLDVGRTIILERDENYWAKDLPSRRGQFNFDRVRVDFYRDDTAALLAFKAGAHDFRRETDPRRWAESYDVPGIKKAEFKNSAP